MAPSSLTAAPADSDAGHMNWTSSTIEAHQPTVLELAASRHHYHAPCARTVYVGAPSEGEARFAEVCYEAMDKLLEVARPGNSIFNA